MIRQYKEYSVLGHLDMIQRYDRFGDYPDDRIMGMVDRILSQVIADGKGIEVNTSSFKYGVKDLMPSRAILRLYRELGGTILTIGSDTHETVHLGDHIAEVKQVLKEMGYQTFNTFSNMEPVYHSL